ncbi:MAG: glycosyltransferase family 2 protein [Erysipelotrichaceae bacterium]|nr:glycosyltransferase family 2 protein [Erysipelotrichaceae bacterium]
MIIVDDFSCDGTKELLKTKLFDKVDKIIYHDQNRGKGAALRTGFTHASGDIVMVQDADNEYDPNEYPRLIKPILEDGYDVVYGSRFKKTKGYARAYWQNILANRFLTSLSNLFTGLKLTDMETCYKVFKKDIIQGIKLEEDRFGFEPEITAKIAKYKIKEVSISYYPRTKEEGKKIGYKDGLRAIYCILKYRRGR